MPIVSGNEPEKQEGGRGIWWLLPILFVASGPITNFVQRTTGWSISQLQVILAGGLVLAAVWLLWPNARAGRGKAPPGAPMSAPPPARLPARLPTPSTPPRAPAPPMGLPGAASQPGRSNSPSAPRFEPYVTGKVMLLGFVLLLLFGAAGLVIVLVGS